MTKRILYVAPTSGTGGAETFLRQTALLHQRARFTPFYAFFRPGPLADALRATGAPVFVASAPPRLSNPFASARTVLWLAQLIRQNKIDLVHSTLAYAALFGAPAAIACRVPHVWFQHGPVSGWQDRLAGWLPSAGILVNSSHTARAQKRLSGRRLEPLRLGVVAPTALPSPGEARSLLRTRFVDQYGEAPEFITAMICRPQPQKGISLWLQALARLRASGVKAGALLVGGNPGGDYEKSLAREASALAVPLLHEASSSDPWALAVGSDALVCASVQPEGYGLTLAEANFHGVCAVAPAEGGPLDIIHDRQNGRLFTPRSAESLAKVLAELAASPEERAGLQARGRNYSATELNAEQSIQSLEEKYAHWLQDPGDQT